MVAASFVQAAAYLSLVALVFLMFVAFGEWLHQLEKRREREIRREHRREHRRHMDSLTPKPWVKP